MGKKSQFFRCFVEGSTISDGRTITSEMIDDIVSTFNRDTYSPRINVEHIKGFSPEPPFNGYGDVIAVKSQVDDITIDGKVEKRKALYCQVDGNDQLVKLAKADQKPFPSVELPPGYAGSDKVGLVGLAFTDSPASIATQKLQFSRSAPGTFHAQGQDAVALAFEESASDPDKVESAIAGFFSALTAKFKGSEPAPKQEKQTPPEPANDNDFAAFATAMGETVAQSIAAALKPVTDASAALDQRFTALEAKLETTEAPGGFSRTPETGGGSQFATDC